MNISLILAILPRQFQSRDCGNRDPELRRNGHAVQFHDLYQEGSIAA